MNEKTKCESFLINRKEPYMLSLIALFIFFIFFVTGYFGALEWNLIAYTQQFKIAIVFMVAITCHLELFHQQLRKAYRREGINKEDSFTLDIIMFGMIYKNFIVATLFVIFMNVGNLFVVFLLITNCLYTIDLAFRVVKMKNKLIKITKAGI